MGNFASLKGTSGRAALRVSVSGISAFTKLLALGKKVYYLPNPYAKRYKILSVHDLQPFINNFINSFFHTFVESLNQLHQGMKKRRK